MSGDTQQSTTSYGSENTDLYGGIVLGVATIAALVVANSPLGHQYEALLHSTGEVRIGSIGLAKSLEHWINDGLMAIFFLLIGLEIKREAMQGALASVKQAALPVAAATGGFGAIRPLCEAGRSPPRPTSPLRSASARCWAARFRRR